MAEPGSSDKWRYTLYTTFVLLLLFNPETYKLMNSLLGRFVGPVASKEGCPTMLGFVIHAAVFTLVVRYMMDLRI
uniref:Uncharacterized protein n=1 Tax=viral metagenome TaxID=1070528 RepID=A0A6C0B2E1_9ZZZZ